MSIGDKQQSKVADLGKYVHLPVSSEIYDSCEIPDHA